jgi:hypothetical protein
MNQISGLNFLVSFGNLWMPQWMIVEFCFIIGLLLCFNIVCTNILQIWLCLRVICRNLLKHPFNRWFSSSIQFKNLLLYSVVDIPLCILLRLYHFKTSSWCCYKTFFGKVNNWLCQLNFNAIYYLVISFNIWGKYWAIILIILFVHIFLLHFIKKLIELNINHLTTIVNYIFMTITFCSKKSFQLYLVELF